MEQFSSSVSHEQARWTQVERLLDSIAAIDDLLADEFDQCTINEGLSQAGQVAGDLSKALEGCGNVLVTAVSVDGQFEPRMPVLLFSEPRLVGISQRTDGSRRCELVFMGDVKQVEGDRQERPRTELTKMSAEGLHIQPVFGLDPTVQQELAVLYVQDVFDSVSDTGTLDLTALDVKVAVMPEFQREYFELGIDDRKPSANIRLRFNAATKGRARSYPTRPASIDTTKGRYEFDGFAVEDGQDGDTHLRLKFTPISNNRGHPVAVAVRDIVEYQLLDD